MQTRKASLLEAVVNVAIGFLIALVVQVALMEAYAVPTTFAVDLQITCIFTFVSLVRSYVLRRLFNLFDRHGT